MWCPFAVVAFFVCCQFSQHVRADHRFVGVKSVDFKPKPYDKWFAPKLPKVMEKLATYDVKADKTAHLLILDAVDDGGGLILKVHNEYVGDIATERAKKGYQLVKYRSSPWFNLWKCVYNGKTTTKLPGIYNIGFTIQTILTANCPKAPLKTHVNIAVRKEMKEATAKGEKKLRTYFKGWRLYPNQKWAPKKQLVPKYDDDDGIGSLYAADDDTLDPDYIVPPDKDSDKDSGIGDGDSIHESAV